MSANHDISRVVRSWIREEEHDSADRVLEVVLSRLDSTPQRRSWWPAWRSPQMNRLTALAAGAVALVVLAVVAYQFLPTSSVGPPRPSPTPVVTPEPTETPPDIPAAGPMDPGRYFARLEGVGFTFEVPAGWVSNGDFGIDKAVGIGPDGAAFIFWIEDADAVFTDPCERVLGPPAGPLAADLAAAIAEMPQIDLVSGPTAVTVGGQPAQHVAITIPTDIPCEPNAFYLWGDETDDGQARYATTTGMTIDVWLIDVDGVRVQIDGETYEGAGPEPGEELEAIINSIEFE